MEPTSPTPRKPSEQRVLDYLRAHADSDGCVRATRQELAAALELAPSTAQLALAGLRDAGEISITSTRGGAPNFYCVTPTDDRPTPTEDRPTPTDSDRPIPTDSPRAPTPERGGSPPTSSLGVSGSPIPEGTQRPTDRPTDSDRPIPTDRPIGSLAVAAAMDAAKAAGRSIEPALRARIGQAAQRIAATDVPIETILAAARRMGEAGTTDLATAVAAIEERRAMPASAVERPAPEGSKVASTIRLVRATWPRVVIDGEVWEEKLATIPERYLLAAVDELAKAGGEFAPHWGQVYKAAWRIGVDDSNRRRDAAERKRLRDLVTAIEEGRA